jgi:tetratricopeptide (TPR) repeat protein
VTGALPRPLAAGLAIAALGGAIAAQSARDLHYPRAEAARTRVLYVRSPAAMKRLTFGFQALAADVYWIRAIQHYGGDRLDKTPAAAGRRYELLYPLLDIATSLDPYFNIAYRFGAIFLGEPFPGGPGRPDLAIGLLRKAIAAMPQKWQYYHDIAFVYYWRLHDYKAAGEWFERAAAQPGAPNWLPSVAASMLSRSDDRATARFMWRQLLTSEQEWVRRNAERSLLQLQVLDQIDQLHAALLRGGRAAGGAYSWTPLIARGWLAGVPLDPTGTPYELDPLTGRVRVSSASTLFPMPDEPERLQ